MTIGALQIGGQLFQGLRDIFTQPDAAEAGQSGRLAPNVREIPAIRNGNDEPPPPPRNPRDEITLSREALRALGIDGLNGEQVDAFIRNGTQAFDETPQGFVAFRQNVMQRLEENSVLLQEDLTRQQERLGQLQEQRADTNGRFARTQLEAQIRQTSTSISDLEQRIFFTDSRIDRFRTELQAFNGGGTAATAHA